MEKHLSCVNSSLIDSELSSCLEPKFGNLWTREFSSYRCSLYGLTGSLLSEVPAPWRNTETVAFCPLCRVYALISQTLRTSVRWSVISVYLKGVLFCCVLEGNELLTIPRQQQRSVNMFIY